MGGVLSYQSQFNSYGGDTASIQIDASPQLTFLTANKPVLTDANQRAVSGDVDLKSMVTNTLPVVNGGTNSTVALTNGNLMVSAGNAIIEGTSASTPTFVGATISGLTASRPVKTDAAKALVSAFIALGADVTGTLPVANGGTGSATALTNGKLILSAGGVFVEGTSSSAPTFAGATISGLTASMPVKTDGAKGLVSGLISLTADVTGVLPAANGGAAPSAGPVGSAPNVNGASFAGQVLTLQPADATRPGVIAAAAQSLPGSKTVVGDYLRVSSTANSELSMSNNTGSKPGMSVTATQVSGQGLAALELGSDLGTTRAAMLRITSESTGNVSYIVAPNGAHTFYEAGSLIASFSAVSNFVNPTTLFVGAVNMSSALTLARSSNQLVFWPTGVGNSLTLTAANPATASRTFTLPDVGANSSFMMLDGAQTVAGLKTFAGVQFSNATAGYTPTTLNYYEEGTFVMAMSGAFTASQNVTFTFRRVGKAVTIEWPDCFAATSVSATIQSAAGAIPARFRPTNNPRASYAGRSGGTDCFVTMLFSSAGQLTVYNSTVGVANFPYGIFAGASTGGFASASVSLCTP